MKDVIAPVIISVASHFWDILAASIALSFCFMVAEWAYTKIKEKR